MKNKKPLISIITVVYNGEKYLEETIQSIVFQTYENIEYIIIDGGSTDSTVEIIKKYEDKISYWVSEPDKGIYDAMNKGIEVSNGEIIGIVNADDILYSTTLEEVVKYISLSNADYTYGSVDLMDEKGILKGCMISMNNDDILQKMYVDMPFPHPTMFVKKEVYQAIGLFNLKFRLSSDYDFVLRVLEANYKGVRLPNATGKFRSGGASGGIETFIDTKNVLLSHNISRFIVYKNMYISIAKVFLLKYFPDLGTKFRENFRKKSRHKIYKD